MEQELISKIWILHGMFGGGTPGLILFKDGRFSLVTEEGEHFNVPLNEAKDIKWPFLQLGLGFNASVNNQKYKFTFAKPNGAADLQDSSLDQVFRLSSLARGIEAFALLGKVGEIKKSAKQWRAVIGG